MGQKPRCVYCLRDEGDTTFKYREHVMPQFLGTYTPLNPVLVGDLVCDPCNNDVFSPLERNFSEDSEEGITGQMLNIDDRHSIRLRGKNVKLVKNSGLGVDFFDNIFPFLRYDGDRLVVELKPQVQLKNYEGVYQVFLPEALKNIKKDGREFKKVKDRLAKLDPKDMHVIAPAEHEGDDSGHTSIVQVLAEYGINYNAGEKVFAPIEGGKTVFNVEMQCTVDRNLARVLAKVAFNYFIYCAKADQDRETLFKEDFDKIRRFICGDEAIPLKEIVISVDKDVILGEEAELKKRLLAHVIVFEEVNGRIIARLSFWGKRIYEIDLGTVPENLERVNLGCGHVFNPFTQEIHNISQEQKYDATKEVMEATFGLHKKIR